MSTDLDALRNLGAIRLGEPVPKGDKTVVVLGVARGGTSMAASVLRALGIFLGDQAVAPVFEDVRLATAIESGDVEQARAVVADYDAAHSVWGFKRPGLVEHLEAAHGLFRNPVYVVMFRDVLAIANRNVLSMKSDPLGSMKQSLRQYGLLRNFVATTQPRCLLLSNEKALLHAEAFVSEVADWLGLDVTSEQKAAAVAVIAVDPPQYLNASRLHFVGRLDRATTEYVSGWAFIKGRGGAAALEVTVNGRLVGTVTADRHRPDLLSKGMHATGFCGFRYEFPGESRVAKGDTVSVRFALGREELKGAPREAE